MIVIVRITADGTAAAKTASLMKAALAWPVFYLLNTRIYIVLWEYLRLNSLQRVCRVNEICDRLRIEAQHDTASKLPNKFKK